jgi:transposase
MAKFYRKNYRSQSFLLPPNMLDWLDEDDIVHFIIETVAKFDLSAFERNPEKDTRGRPGLDPRTMVALLLYGYCQGERSSRRIETLCVRDVAYRVVSAQLFPDHTSIARFRKNHEKALGDLFSKVLTMCADAGLVKLGRVALDGTKIKANAALDRNRTLETLREKVATWLSEAEKTDREEDKRPEEDGNRLPPGLARKEERQARIKKCLDDLEAKAKEIERVNEEKKQARVEREATEGPLRGRKPKDTPVDSESLKANTTDPESRIMISRREGHVQAYNAQIVVTEEQIIVGTGITQEANDMHQMVPMLEATKDTLKKAGIDGEPREVLADTGYWNATSLALDRPGEQDLFIAPFRKARGRKRKDGSDPKQKAPTPFEEKMNTEISKAVLKRRGAIVEAVFGQIKTVRGATRFMRRGMRACASEWSLLCATHNLLKLFRARIKAKQAGAPCLTPASCPV